jgi:hypothetical protein
VASTGAGIAALDAEQQGLASGILATAAQLGTALGLATIVPLAAARADALGAGAAAAATLIASRRQSVSSSSSAAGASSASICAR